MINATITGWGKCVPQSILTNDDLASVIDTSDEWIVSRSGIKERRVSHVSNSDLATLASKRALAAAGRSADEIDYIILATCTPDRQIPSSACYVQTKLGATNAAAADINAGCSGFIYGLAMAYGLIGTSQASKVLVIGSERTTPYLDFEERATAVLFGDGAGAVVLEATDADVGIRAIRLGADGSGSEWLTARGLGTDYAGSGERLAIIMDGTEVFKGAVKQMGDSSVQIAAEAGWEPDDIDLLIPHQANLRIIDAVRRRIGAPEDKVFVNIHKYGNTSAATIPIALAEALDEGRIDPGSRVVLVAYGAGITWGACALEWGDRVTPTGTVDDALPEPSKTALEMMLEKQVVFS